MWIVGRVWSVLLAGVPNCLILFENEIAQVGWVLEISRYILPVPAAYVSAPAGDVPFPDGPALCGSSACAAQSFIV